MTDLDWDDQWDKQWVIDPEDDTPVWFMDIDGVLNALSYAVPTYYQHGEASPYNGSGWDQETWEEKRDTVTFNGRRYPIRWDPEIIKRICALHDDGQVRIVWLTTWGAGANREFRDLVGMPLCDVIAEPVHRMSGDSYYVGAIWWKWHWVQKFVAVSKARRFIWTDDDLAVESKAIEWASTRNIHCISPDPYVGLRDEDLNKIEKFIRL